MTILTKNTDKLREEVAAIADTFRALCAELTAWAEKTSAHYFQPPDVLLRARAALSDEPPVPEGKKPTRDELWELWLRLNNELPDRPAAVAEFWEHAQIDARARAVLAHWGNHVPPVDGEVAELTGQLIEAANGAAAMGWDKHAQSILRAARRLRPPSLAEQALAKTEAILNDPNRALLTEVREALELNRRALERLQELENRQ